jgi:hypothetical protein
MPVAVHGTIIVTISAQPEKLCILIKTVTAAGVADQREESVAAEIIDPRQGRIRPRNDIFLCVVVKIAVLHIRNSDHKASKTIKYIINIHLQKRKIFFKIREKNFRMLQTSVQNFIKKRKKGVDGHKK